MDTLSLDLVAMILSRCDVSLSNIGSFQLVNHQFHDAISSAHGNVVWRCVLQAAGIPVPRRLFYGGRYQEVAKHVLELKMHEARVRRAQANYFDNFQDWMECEQEMLADRALRTRYDVEEGAWQPVIDANMRHHLVDMATVMLELLRNFSLIRSSFDAESALERYRMFMKLKSVHPELLLIPTAEIELCWVSHILRTDEYWGDMEGHSINPEHSLMLDDSDIPVYSEAIKATAKLWKETFDEEYLPEGFDAGFPIWRLDKDAWEPQREPVYSRPPAYCLAVGPKTVQEQHTDFSVHLTGADIIGDFQWLPDLWSKFEALGLESFWEVGSSMKERLDHLVGSYDRYLWLVRKYPDTPLAPEVSVDLLWHSHQLEPVKYKEWTKVYCGFHLRHNMFPKGPGKSVLVTPDSAIQCLWKKEFGVLHTEDHLYCYSI